MNTQPLTWRRACCLAMPALMLLATAAMADEGLVQVREDFTEDPGWEAVNNRVVGVGGPTIHQNFGWSPGENGRGAVGGEIWSSVTPATYGMPIGPFDLKRRLSASGKVAIKKMSSRSGLYFGFYNSTRQGWRPWSSMMLEFGKVRQKFALKPIDKTPAAGINLIVLPADWRSDGVNRDLRVPVDGKPHAWSFVYEPNAKMADGKVRSQITVHIEGDKPFVGLPEMPDLRDHPAVMDRFGIVNNQSYGVNVEAYFSDLKINDHAIDLSRDPRWVGQGNRVTYPAWSFHGRHDYGFVETNWAGKSPGELGGLAWSTEMPDPTFGYYADDIGRLTLEDPISFSGSICNVDGQPDSGLMFGYFNTKSLHTKDFKQRLIESMGLFVEGPSSVGKTLMTYCTARTGPDNILSSPPLFQADRKRRHFTFQYDPKANNGVGRITLTLDGKTYVLDLTPEQRKAGATFDRFGMRNMRGGGKFVEIYFDDLTYTARRAKDHRPVRHKQGITELEYPEGGRRY